MRLALPALFLVAAAAASVGAAGGAAEERLAIPRFERAAELYARNCQGCHGHTGVSVDEVPDLSGRVGWFLHTAAGRDYVVRVPGVAFALIGDDELAMTLNWMLQTYSAGELPDAWTPFSSEEVGRLRRRPVASIQQERAAVVEELVRRGVIPDAETVSFGAEPNY